MFESLADRLQAVFKKLSGKGRLGEEDVREAMKQVRLALLEADVNLQVVRDFVTKVSARAVGEEVSRSLTPSQQVIKIVRNELVSLLGDAEVPLAEATLPPTVIMLVGLQGAGKTTHAAKLALFLRKKGKRPLLVAADVYRPAAVTRSNHWAGRLTSRYTAKVHLLNQPKSWLGRSHMHVKSIAIMY